MERALMEGGHEVPVRKPTGATFIQELSEARMFKTREQISKEGVRSLSDHLMISLLSLYIMSNDYNYAPVASAYAQKTISLGNFNRPSPSGTDLYQTVYSLQRQDMFNDAKDTMLMGKIRVDSNKIKRFTSSIVGGKTNPSSASQFFLKLERDLQIQDPKIRAARRLAQDWPTLNTQQRQLVASQMMRYYRLNARRSDIMPLFSNFVKDNKLAIGGAQKLNIARKIAKGAASFAAGYAIGKNIEV